MTLTPTERITLSNLRSRGFAVVAFNPSELNTMSPGHLEDSLITHANENLIPPPPFEEFEAELHIQNN